MDPKHRHELEQNDLQQFLANFGAWWERYGTYILAVVLVVVVVVTGNIYYRRYTSERHEAAWRDLATAASPESLRAIGQEYEDRDAVVAAQAYLRGADLFLAQAATPRDPDELPDPTVPSPLAAEEALGEAEAMYRRALALSDQAGVLVRLNAWLGLAALAEARADWPGAAEWYRQVEAQAAEQYPLLQAQAQTRLALLPRLQEPIRFAPAPAPPPLPPPGDLAPLGPAPEPDEPDGPPAPPEPPIPPDEPEAAED